MKLTLTAADYHRNGIAGQPFRVALFRNETEKRDMLAILTDDNGDDYGQKCNGRCYVLDVAMLAEGNIRMGENSWRGDDYEGALRPLIEAELKRQAEELRQRETEAAEEADLDAYPTGTVDDLERYPNDGSPWPGERPPCYPHNVLGEEVPSYAACRACNQADTCRFAVKAAKR